MTIAWPGREYMLGNQEARSNDLSVLSGLYADTERRGSATFERSRSPLYLHKPYSRTCTLSRIRHT